MSRGARLPANPALPEQNKLLGVLLMCAAMFTGVSIDASVKGLAGDYSTAQIIFLRGLAALPIILFLVARQGSLRDLTGLPFAWQAWRGVLAVGMTFGYFYALKYIPLVTAMLLAHVSPILIVLIARPLLGEKIEVSRLGGVVLGFLGVVAIIQPTSLSIHPAFLAVLGSALCWALLSLNNRQLAGTAPAVLAFYTYPLSIIVGGIYCWSTFVVPTGIDWLLYGIVAVGSAVTHWLVALAYRYAQAGVIAPFEYTALIWATVAGFVFWSEIPTIAMLLGGVLILAGGYIAVRDRPA